MRTRISLPLAAPLLALSLLLDGAQPGHTREPSAGHLPLEVFYDLVADDRTARAALERIDSG
jgi:hypothetical protein